jgi:hypothetical protein
VFQNEMAKHLMLPPSSLSNIVEGFSSWRGNLAWGNFWETKNFYLIKWTRFSALLLI